MFRALAERLHKENALSDVVYAMLYADSGFAGLFLEFFGVPSEDYASIRVEREFELDNRNRIDFRIEYGSHLLLVENKIRDTNYHVDDYDRAIRELGANRGGNTVKAIISVARINRDAVEHAKSLGWVVKYWKDFLNVLRANVAGMNPIIAESIVAYLSVVADIREVEQMHFDQSTLRSVASLNVVIGEIIESAGDQVIEEYSTKHANGVDWVGRYYILPTGRKSAYCWFGLMFGGPVTIVVDRDWSPEVCVGIEANPSEFEIDDDICETEWSTVQNGKLAEFSISLKGFPEPFSKLSVEEQKARLERLFEAANALIRRAAA